MGKRTSETGLLHSSVRGRHGELLSTSYTLARIHDLYRPKHIESNRRGRDGHAIGPLLPASFFNGRLPIVADRMWTHI